MTSRKCLIVDPIHESLLTMLKEIGWEAAFYPDVTRDEISRIHRGYDGLIVRSKTRVDRELLGENPTIRFVARAGAGLDNLDLGYLEEKNIRVLHAAEGNRDAVGEHAVGILLALLRFIPQANQEVRDLIWEREGNRGEEIKGKTVSIVGYGNMGQAFASRLRSFGCKILAYDKYKQGFGSDWCEEVTMERVFAETEILSLHVPLTAETRGLVNYRYVQQFSRNIILINTARGEIVPLAELARAMREGKVRGAALDVLENEKLSEMTSSQQESFNYLKSKSNVIFTPHIAGWTFESHIKINVALAQKIAALDL